MRGNWQKRVERTQLRRDQAKAKKIRKGQKAVYKALVQNELWPLLDRFKDLPDSGSPVEKFHLWVDCMPKSKAKEDSEFQENEESDSRKSKKGKKKSKGDASPAFKKAHPRSHENMQNDVEGENMPMLCHQFFFGECEGLAKGSKSKKNSPSCQHCHYTVKRDLTLAAALSLKSRKETNNSALKSVEVLRRASNAAAFAQMKLDGVEIDDATIITDADLENAAIDMMYYMQIPMVSTNGGESKGVVDTIMKLFSKEDVNIGSIAYVAYGNVLLFDRFDGGVVMGRESEEIIFGNKDNARRARSDSISDSLIHFPGTVLEHIIDYLPTGYAGIFPRVCKSLHQEVGTTSPSLWKALIERNGWPPLEDPLDSDPIDFQKAAFISHFRICERVKAFTNGIKKLVNKDVDSNPISENTAVVRFQDKENIKSDNSILSLWDEGGVVIGSKSDCSLRLYKCYGQKSSDEKALREVFNLRLAPVPLSKKVECKLESIAFDDRYVACSFSVNGEGFVTSITKEELLSNSTENVIEDNDMLQIHDLTECCKEYHDYNTIEERDPFRDIDLGGGDVDSVGVVILDDLKACGNGIFCAIAKVSASHGDDGEDGESNNFGIISLSSSKGRHVILDFLHVPIQQWGPAKLLTNYYLKERTKCTEITCFAASLETEMCSTTVDRKGNFGPMTICGEHTKMRLPTTPGWSLEPTDIDSSHAVRTQEYFVSSYLLQNQTNLEKRVACLFSQATVEKEVIPATIFLKSKYERILSIKCMDKDYLILACACEDLNIGFDLSEFPEEMLVDFVIVHIPTKTEIQRQRTKLCLPQAKLPKLFEVDNSTITGLVDEFGISLSGARLDDSASSTDEIFDGSNPKPKKKVKKKKRLAPAKSGKKDGFARGIV